MEPNTAEKWVESDEKRIETVRSRIETVLEYKSTLVNAKGETVHLVGPLADAYRQIQGRMTKGQMTPQDVKTMEQLMQWANMPEAWRVAPTPAEPIAPISVLPAQKPIKDEGSKLDSKPKVDVTKEAKKRSIEENQLGALLTLVPELKFKQTEFEEKLKWIDRHFVFENGYVVCDKSLDLGKIATGRTIQLPKKFRINGDLDLSHVAIKTIPTLVMVEGSVDLTGSLVEKFEGMLEVRGDLIIRQCEYLKNLPVGSSVKGSVQISDCPELEFLPSSPIELRVKGHIVGDIKAKELAKNLGKEYFPSKSKEGAGELTNEDKSYLFGIASNLEGEKQARVKRGPYSVSPSYKKKRYLE
jgi:hypothetical protein